ncbi:MAG: thioesterase [Lachnospiraceae bacterium]|nr:thioesterase [Lachnospiraceae bacterium]
MSKIQLFCFTFAGGTAAFFDTIEKDLDGIDVVKLEYPGHGTRHKEPFCRDFDELAEDMYRLFLENYAGGEYALMGYSMGTISLVEVLKRILRDRSIQRPSRVFLAAHEPHPKVELSGFAEQVSDEWVMDRTVRFGAVPEKLRNNRSFWRMYLPIYRADYEMIARYRFDRLDLTTDIPATLFYSEQDTPRPDMELWKNCFTGVCELHEYEGTHFFIQEHHSEMARVIERDLRTQGDRV